MDSITTANLKPYRILWVERALKKAEEMKKKVQESNLDPEAKEYLQKLCGKEIGRLLWVRVDK